MCVYQCWNTQIIVKLSALWSLITAIHAYHFRNLRISLENNIIKFDLYTKRASEAPENLKKLNKYKV